MKLSSHVIEDFFERELKIGPMRICMATLLVLMEIIAYTIAFSILTIEKHYCFRTYAWDLGIFMQALYTTAFKGQLLHYNVELHTNPSGSFFGVHFSPVLFLLVPLYRIAPRAETLLVLQSLVIGLGALPTYRIASLTLDSPFAGVAFATIYLLYTPLHGVNWFDFHVEAFLPLLYLYTFYYLITRRYWRTLAFILLGLSTIEFAPILYVALVLYMLMVNLIHRRISKREVLLYILIIALSTSWFVLACKVVSAFNPLKAGGAVNVEVWSHFGSTLQEMLFNVLSHPLDALKFMLANDTLNKANYLSFIFLPVLFLSFLSPLMFILLVGSWLFPAFLSSYQGLYGDGQYPAYIVAQVFISAIYGLRNLVAGNKQVAMRFSIVLLLVNCILTSILSPLGLGAYAWWFAKPTHDVHTESLAYVVSMVETRITDKTSLLVQSHVFPHFAHHLNVYTSPIPNITGTPILGDGGVKMPWGKTVAWKIEKVDMVIIDQRSANWGIPLVGSNEYKPIMALDWITVLCRECKEEFGLMDIKNGHGLLAEVYNTAPSNFSLAEKPVVSMVVYSLDVNMGPWSPIPTVGKLSHASIGGATVWWVGDWCVRFRGWIYAPQEGFYEFMVESDDGSTLMIDGLPVIKGFGSYMVMHEKGSIYLTKGWHTIEILWGQGPGVAYFNLKWKAPSMESFANIPLEYLRWRVESGEGG
jgi:uncharacterized membrane protein